MHSPSRKWFQMLCKGGLVSALPTNFLFDIMVIVAKMDEFNKILMTFDMSFPVIILDLLCYIHDPFVYLNSLYWCPLRYYLEPSFFGSISIVVF
jgi:hypothetical protein